MPATSTPLVSVAGFGSAAVETARLAASLTNAVNRLVQIAGSGPGAYVATFAVLSLYSDQAGKDSDKVPAGVRNALALEASALGLPGTADLQSVAKAGGTVDMPVRLTSAAQESPSGKSQIAAMLTNGATVPKGVPVRAATLNAATGRYEVTVPAKSTVPNTPPLILTWTPATPPGSQNPSSTTPLVPQPVPVYEGATITPVQAEPESYPGVPLDLDDLIVIFPVGSGVKPIYIMFNHNPHDVVIDDKIREQIPIRGWTEVEIRDVIGKGATGSSSDKRRPNKTIDGLGRNDSATVYGSPPNGYIVVNDRTGEIIQIADRNDSAWAVDGRIIWRNK
ncbi:MAG: S-type pyocin domain-containing protein [Pseudomonas aeruginosa]|nr:S-type pyocin domain-containing protein [Pseudomonas aeruginosa]